MDRIGRRRRRLQALLVVGTMCPGALGCSLGLDRSLMNGLTGPSDVGVHAGDASVPNEGATAQSDTCLTDADCAPAGQANACVTSSSCDPTFHVCILKVCDVGACAVASCDLLSQQCGAPISMDFTISVFPVVSGGIGGLGPGYALAAAYPFLFVLTTNGVVAYNVANPTGNVPSMVTVQGLPFIPVALVASGRRVYFASGVEGSGPTFRQAIAWIDVPANPFLTSLTASSSFIGTTQPTLASVMAASAGLELVYASSFDPTATLAPPLVESMVVVPAPIVGLASGAALVASSGTELIAYRYATSSRHPVFSMVSGALQNSGVATPEQTVTAYGPVDNEASFASGSDGTVLWESAPMHAIADGGTNGVGAARLARLIPATAGGLLDTSVFVDLETYPNATAGPVVGPTAWLDPSTSVALAASAENTLATSVQVFDRTTGALVAGRRGVIPAAPQSLGIAASNGFAYVLAPNDSMNRSANVYVLAPGCSGVSTSPTEAGAASPDGSSADASADGGGGAGHASGFQVLGNVN